MVVRREAKKLSNHLSKVITHLDACGVLSDDVKYTLECELERVNEIHDDCHFALREARCVLNEYTAVTNAARLLMGQTLVSHPDEDDNTEFVFKASCERLWRMAVMEENTARNALYEIPSPRKLV